MTERVVVIGAGIAGVSLAHRLTTHHGMSEVTLIDPMPPLTLTSDKSTECYRNWWPNQPMVALMNRSIDLLEEFASRTNNLFGLNRRGYLFVTADVNRRDEWVEQANRTSGFGGGPVRIHPGPMEYRAAPPHGYQHQPDGVDIFEDGSLVRAHFPYVTERAVGAIHVRRAGWFSAQQLGAWMVEEAKEHGLSHVPGRVAAIRTVRGRISGVELADGSHIECAAVVNAAGPLAAGVGEMVGIELPLRSEVHLKVAYREHRQVVPREAPMIIWSDTQHIAWSEEEAEALAAEGRDDLLGEMPVFCHGRPEGGAGSNYFLGLWEYHGDVRQPSWPLPADDLYPEVVIRGLTTMVPGFSQYLDGLPQATVDGGYYTKTPENRPLLGPAGPDGYFLACGYSGFGVMVAAGAADLVAAHITESDLPEYAEEFLLSRYDNPEYLHATTQKVDTGQL
ncbi:MAG TPA: FAD-binding oxidoreductase [Acidimicrobiia bacterium]